MPGEASETQIRELELVVERDPSTALYLPLAERLRDMGRVEDAIRLCEARKTRPGRGVGDAIVLGRCYLADGRLAEARSEFEAALRMDRENVIALKALGGILAHEGRHARAVEMYRAVCRIDPGDLESQTALHQITSGEFAEVSPADVVVGQGDLGWHPVRLPREEDHLADLGMGLRMIDTFDAPAAPTAERRKDHGFREFSLDDLDRKKPAATTSAPAASSSVAPAPAAPPAPKRSERTDSLERYDVPTPVAPVQEYQAALGAPLEEPLARAVPPVPEVEPAHASAAAEAPAKLESADVPTAAAPPAMLAPADAPAAPEPATLEPAATAEPTATRPDETPESPASEGARGEAYKHGVSGNRSAFQEWLRRLGGGV